MRIAVVSHLYPRFPGDISGIFVAEQVRALQGIGVTVEVISPVPWDPRHNASRIRSRASGMERIASCAPCAEPHVQFMPTPILPRNGLPKAVTGLVMSRLLVRELARIDRNHQPDLVHAHCLTPDGYAALLACRKLGTPLVCTCHGSDINVYPAASVLTRQATVAVLTRAQRLVFVAESLRTRARALVNQTLGGYHGGSPPARRLARSSVVHSGADPRTFRPGDRFTARRILGLPESGIVAVYAGRLAAEKGLTDLLVAWRSLLDRTQHSAGRLLCLVGEGPEMQGLCTSIHALRLKDRVFLPGRAGRDQLATWFNAADVLVLPSHTEGFPVVLVEAMMCGLPVIATDVGGVREIVDDGRNGLLVPAGAVDVLSARLAEVLQQHDFRARLAAGALVTGVRLSWHDVARQLLELYEQTIQEAGQKSESRAHGSELPRCDTPSLCAGGAACTAEQGLREVKAVRRRRPWR